MQVKLLRAIQERAVRPVGAHAEEPVDVRILSASHRDLGALAAEGKFRQDLYFRINVITLHVPPLRERREDISGLAAHILERLAARDGAGAHMLDKSALDALARYGFPGNVRELENLLERACALCDGIVIGAADLELMPLERRTELSQPPSSWVQPDDGGDEEPPQGEADEARTHVLRTLDSTRWNRAEAARRLGLTLRQLRYRLHKWGLE